MERVKVAADTITYNVAFSACETDKSGKSYLACSAPMAHARVATDSISYNVAFNARVKGQEWNNWHGLDECDYTCHYHQCYQLHRVGIINYYSCGACTARMLL